MVSMGMFFWPRTGLWPCLKRRPVEDFTPPRCFGILLFLALFFFNDPLFLLQVFLPDSQQALRELSSCLTTLAVAIYLGYITHVIYAVKFSAPSPPSLVIWVTEAKRKAKEIDEEAERFAEDEAAHMEETGQTHLSPDRHRPALYPDFDRPPKAYLKTPIFFLSSAKYLVDEDDDDDDDDAKYAGKRVLPSKKKKIVKKKKGVSITDDGYRKFGREFMDQSIASVLEVLREDRGGVSWMTVWRDIVAPLLITAGILCVWITSFQVFLAQMNDGPTPRPRLTFSFAYDKHPAEATGMVYSIGFQTLLLFGCIVYATEEVSLSVKAHLCFLGITVFTGVLLILATMNCSYYPLGTPFLEVITSRTLPNCYAWVVSFMTKPLETVAGRFPKRAEDGEEYESSEEEDEEEEEEDDKSVRTVVNTHKELVVPTMGGVVKEGDEENSDSESTSSSRDDEEEGEEGDGNEDLEEGSGSLETGSELDDTSASGSSSASASLSTRR